MTEDQLKDIEDRSKNDHASKMIVGSEVRELIVQIRFLRRCIKDIFFVFIGSITGTFLFKLMLSIGIIK